MKINFGSGESKLEGFVNIDSEIITRPDVVHDIRKNQLPFAKDSIDEIWFHHCVEHIELFNWSNVFTEFYRVLKMNGLLFMSYPEFEICSKYYLENYKGQRDFWRNCLYGRQLYPGDYHVT